MRSISEGRTVKKNYYAACYFLTKYSRLIFLLYKEKSSPTGCQAGNTEGGSGKVGKAVYRIKQDTDFYEKETEYFFQT
jgi:hypothetical protein